MRKSLIVIWVIALVPFALIGQDYVGSHKCKSCHKKEESGAQYIKWSEGVHAKAFETLKSEEAAAVAKKAGLKTPAHESPECVGCHTTGYGKGGYEIKDEAFWNPAKDDKDGKKAVKVMEGLQAVGCESCHGPGGDYKSKKVMQAIFDGSTPAGDVGLWTPNEKICVECHNEKSPTYKPFKFDERVKEVGHPYPEGFRK